MLTRSINTTFKVEIMKCFLNVVAGIALYIGGTIAGVAWLAFCFGTVIIGVLLLIFSPGILFAPFLFGFSMGTALIAVGCENNRQDG